MSPRGYPALRVRDGQEITLTAPSRNTAGSLRLLRAVEEDNPVGELSLIGDNLSSHKSAPIRDWLACHPRVHRVFIPKGACWLKMREGWWRLFRREAFAGQTVAAATEIERARELAPEQLNRRAKPWVWGRPLRPRRRLRRRFVYCL